MTGDPTGSDDREKPENTPGANPAPGVGDGNGGPGGDAENAGEKPRAEDETPAGPGSRESAPEHGSVVESDLNALVEESRSKADEYLDLAQRTKADFDNYRKRMAAENQAAAQRGRLDVAGSLIEAIDNLERVLDAAGIDQGGALEDEIPAEAPIAEQGVIVAWRDLHAVLRKAGVEGYSPQGEQFDPEWHEALQAIPVEGADSGTVVEVMQRGYRSGDTVLRAARVVVAQ